MSLAGVSPGCHLLSTPSNAYQLPRGHMPMVLNLWPIRAAGGRHFLIRTLPVCASGPDVGQCSLPCRNCTSGRSANDVSGAGRSRRSARARAGHGWSRTWGRLTGEAGENCAALACVASSALPWPPPPSLAGSLGRAVVGCRPLSPPTAAQAQARIGRTPWEKSAARCMMMGHWLVGRPPKPQPASQPTH